MDASANKSKRGVAEKYGNALTAVYAAPGGTAYWRDQLSLVARRVSKELRETALLAMVVALGDHL